MKIGKPNFFIAILFFLSSNSNGQTLKTLEDLENKNQSCLDSGKDMLGCVIQFYFQTDSLLNVVYKKIISSTDPSKKVDLKKEQRKWLVSRDKYFKSIDKNKGSSKYEDGDTRMMIIQKKAEFVSERVEELIKSFLLL